MARRKSGRDISGWVIVDKPAGPTSTAVVNKLRWAFGANKAGHAGTLDPAATGVLAVAFGEATKAIPFLTEALKAYRFTVRFGAATNTDDAEGEVIARSDLRPDAAQIEAALGQFTGDILQVPPKYSAVKIDGVRAYALAREDAQFEIAARPLFVETLRLVGQPEADLAEFEMICGKGGYVRAIARDLGADLGCLGHVVSLRRTWSGPFEVGNAVPLQKVVDLAQTPDLEGFLLPVEAGLVDVPRATCGAEAAVRLRHGNAAQVLTCEGDYGDVVWVAHQGQPVAVGTYRAGMVQPSRVFNL